MIIILASTISPKGKVCSAQTKNTILDNIIIDRERNRTFQGFNEENQPEKVEKQGFYCKIATPCQVTVGMQR